MALNIKPRMTKDHPEGTHPAKPIDEGRETSGEDSADITKRQLNQEAMKKSLTQKLKEELKKKVDPKRILRRLNIIN